jgi:hypothetical protein
VDGRAPERKWKFQTATTIESIKAAVGNGAVKQESAGRKHHAEADFHSMAGAASIPANTDVGDYLPWQAEFVGRRKRAVVTVCKKIRSKAEFHNVMQHMTGNGATDARGWQANFSHVKAFLDMGADSRDLDKQVDDYVGGLAMLDSGAGLQMLYEGLYGAPVLG